MSRLPGRETDRSSTIRAWMVGARPRTLVAAIIPVAVGISLALESGSFHAFPAGLCLLFAMLVQVATNFANDYFDARKGADTPERLGPVRAVASGLIAPSAMLRATILVLFLAFLIGLGLLPHGGWRLLVVGVASLVLAVVYTGGPFPLAYLGLGDIFVVFFFGLVAVGFTYFVQAGEFSRDAWVAGFAVGLIVNNLLVVNNYRDVAGDRKVGKKTLAVRLGRPFSIWQLKLQSLGACFCLAWINVVPSWYWMLPMLILGIESFRVSRLMSHAVSPQEFNVCLGITARMIPLYGILLCIGILT